MSNEMTNSTRFLQSIYHYILLANS